MVLGKKFCNVYQGHFRFGDYPDLICYRKQEILVKNVDFFLNHHNARHSVLQCCNEKLLFIGILWGTHLVRKILEMVFCFQNRSDLLWEKRLKFEAKGRFPLVKQFIRTVKGQHNFWNIFFNSDGSNTFEQLEFTFENNCDLETYRKN